MITYRGFITYSDSDGSYSEAGNFPATGWKSALEIAMNRATDLVNGDDLVITQKITRGKAGIESATIRVKDETDGTAVLMTITES